MHCEPAMTRSELVAIMTSELNKQAVTGNTLDLITRMCTHATQTCAVEDCDYTCLRVQRGKSHLNHLSNRSQIT